LVQPVLKALVLLFCLIRLSLFLLNNLHRVMRHLWLFSWLFRLSLFLFLRKCFRRSHQPSTKKKVSFLKLEVVFISGLTL
jgi:hypothetical protein